MSQSVDDLVKEIGCEEAWRFLKQAGAACGMTQIVVRRDAPYSTAKGTGSVRLPTADRSLHLQVPAEPVKSAATGTVATIGLGDVEVAGIIWLKTMMNPFYFQV